MSMERAHDCSGAVSVETGSFSRRPPAAFRRTSKDSLKFDFLVKKGNSDLYSCKDFLRLPRIQITVDVTAEQVEDGGESDVLYNMAEKILQLLDGHDRHPGEIVYRLEMKPNSSVALVSEADINASRRSSEMLGWRLAVYTKLSPLSCLCVAERERDNVYFGCNIVLRIPGQTSPYLPTSPTTGVQMKGAALFSQMLRPRAGFAAVQTESGFLALGGYNREGCVATGESFNVNKNAWEESGSLKTSRARFAVVTVQKYMYAIGGTNGKHELASMERCGFGSHWETMKAPMHTARSCFAGAELDGKVYVVGGSHYSCLLKSAEVFDPESGLWQPIAPMPTARSDLAVVSCAGKIYAIGGATYGWRCVSTVECYSPHTNSWQTVASLATTRRNPAAVAFEDRIYVIGGYDGRQVLTSVEVYEPKENKWMQYAPISLGRSSPAAVVSNGLLFVVGGYTGDSFLNSLECCDTRSSEWTSYV